MERDEFTTAFGTGLFLLVAIDGASDPLLPSLAASSRLLDRLQLSSSLDEHTTGMRTLSHHSELAAPGTSLVPVAMTREPRFIVLIEPLEEGADEVVVGRANDTDVPLRHASVSKQHAAFLFDQIGAVGLRDLGSKNGTFLNDVPVTERVNLASGDELRFGSVRGLICDARALWSSLRA